MSDCKSQVTLASLDPSGVSVGTVPTNRATPTRLRKLMLLSLVLAASLSWLTTATNAQDILHPAWQDVYGVWWNNLCRAPSGAWWLYPVANAQPVGTACRTLNTGEVGVVPMR